jgi:hypothetical protein
VLVLVLVLVLVRACVRCRDPRSARITPGTINFGNQADMQFRCMTVNRLSGHCACGFFRPERPS